jgi:hypothetical protein
LHRPISHRSLGPSKRPSCPAGFAPDHAMVAPLEYRRNE